MITLSSSLLQPAPTSPLPQSKVFCNPATSMETAPATKIVRVYSFEAADRLPPDNPAHPLGQVLTSNAGDPATVDWPWRKFFEPYRTSDDKKSVPLAPQREAV